MLNNEDYLNIFHEIKNSITLISSSLQLVEKKHPEVAGFAYWTESMYEITSLRNIVTELSSVRLFHHLNLKSVNLYTYMQEIQNAFSALCFFDFKCETTTEKNLPEVELDSQLIKQALINLLKNAYEAMNKTGTVKMHISSSEKTIKIDVIDRGGGLDPSFADSIFQPFITSKTGGSGLGLVITKQIIESHHGTIKCDSRPGDGCTFTLTLPIRQS